jgi:hypothetical protein
MNKEIKVVIVALIITTIFMIIALRPGLFSMLGYSLDLLIFGDNTSDSIRYEKLVIFSFDALFGSIVFFISYKVAKNLFSK